MYTWLKKVPQAQNIPKLNKFDARISVLNRDRRNKLSVLQFLQQKWNFQLHNSSTRFEVVSRVKLHILSQCLRYTGYELLTLNKCCTLNIHFMNLAKVIVVCNLSCNQCCYFYLHSFSKNSGRGS